MTSGILTFHLPRATSYPELIPRRMAPCSSPWRLTCVSVHTHISLPKSAHSPPAGPEAVRVTCEAGEAQACVQRVLSTRTETGPAPWSF